MAKSARSKKLKKADKAKVKFKVGKPRPKGLNVTNTSFKSKKIVLKEQLQSTEEPTTKKHLNLKDLLVHLSHYNTSMRMSGLSGLQELLNSHEVLIQRHLGNILEKVAPLFIDKEHSVRSRVASLLQGIFSRVSQSQVLPHFSAMSAHLCCAMTHIIPSIQQDSLRIVDLLLDTYPELLLSGSNTILQNFLQQISKQSVGKSRTLTVNPNNKLMSHAGRIKILNQVKKLVGQMLVRNQKSRGDNLVEVVHEWAPTEEQSWVFVQERSVLLPDPLLNVGVKKKKLKEEEEEPDQIISSFMPLMFQTWVEILPQRQDSEEKVLSEEAVATLVCVTDIMKKFWSLIEAIKREDIRNNSKEWYISTYGQDFDKYFSSFPFTQLDTIPQPKSKKRKKTANSRASVTTANLSLCVLAIKFRCHNTQVILNYIYDITCGNDDFNVSEAVEAISALLKLCSTEQQKQTALHAALNIYNKLHPLQKDRDVINDLFLQVLRKDKLDCPAVHDWMESLPKLLLQHTVSSSVLETLEQLALMKHQLFLRLLNSCYAEILGNLTKIKWSRGDKEKCHKSVLNLLFWIGTISPSIDSAVETLIRSDELSSKNKQHLQQLMKARSVWNTDTTEK